MESKKLSPCNSIWDVNEAVRIFRGGLNMRIAKDIVIRGKVRTSFWPTASGFGIGVQYGRSKGSPRTSFIIVTPTNEGELLEMVEYAYAWVLLLKDDKPSEDINGYA